MLYVPISSCLLVVHSLIMSSGITPSTTSDLFGNNLNQQQLYNNDRANYPNLIFWETFLAQSYGDLIITGAGLLNFQPYDWLNS